MCADGSRYGSVRATISQGHNRPSFVHHLAHDIRCGCHLLSKAGPHLMLCHQRRRQGCWKSYRGTVYALCLGIHTLLRGRRSAWEHAVCAGSRGRRCARARTAYSGRHIMGLFRRTSDSQPSSHICARTPPHPHTRAPTHPHTHTHTHTHIQEMRISSVGTYDTKHG
jgi:hypothetical protein